MICVALLSPPLQALTVENKGDNSQESTEVITLWSCFSNQSASLKSNSRAQLQLYTFSYWFAGPTTPQNSWNRDKKPFHFTHSSQTALAFIQSVPKSWILWAEASFIPSIQYFALEMCLVWVPYWPSKDLKNKPNPHLTSFSFFPCSCGQCHSGANAGKCPVPRDPAVPDLRVPAPPVHPSAGAVPDALRGQDLWSRTKSVQRFSSPFRSSSISRFTVF